MCVLCFGVEVYCSVCVVCGVGAGVGVQCVVCGVCGLRSAVCGVRCAVCRVPCAVCGVWCVVCVWCVWCVWRQHTRKRFEPTHGDVLNVHTGRRVLFSLSRPLSLPSFSSFVLFSFSFSALFSLSLLAPVSSLCFFCQCLFGTLLGKPPRTMNRDHEGI